MSPLNSERILTLEVEVHEAGERLDRYLSRAFESAEDVALSRARIQALIATKSVLVDGRPAKRAMKLRGGEQVRIFLPKPAAVALVPEPVPLDVLYEDAHIIAINKPAGLAMHPGAGRTSGTLVNALLAHCRDLSGIGGEQRPGIVHRLDKGTSGVVVVAKSDRAHLGLARQFSRRLAEKHYVAFVAGSPKPAAATLTTLFGRHPKDRKRFSSQVRSGKEAITTYRTVAEAAGLARLQVKLGTGRTHQIRVHLAEMGHPVVGDPTYGGRRYERVKDPELRRLVEKLGRQALHACRLQITHPVSSQPLILRAPLPADLAELWAAMQSLGAQLAKDVVC